MIESWFSVPIYCEKVSNLNNIQNDFSQVFNTLTETSSWQQNPDWKSHQLSDVKFGKNLLEEYNLVNFKSELDFHIRNYLNSINYPSPVNYKIYLSWMTRMDKNEYAHIHHHGNADLSGVYYFKSNGQDGSLFFESPVKVATTSKCFGHLTSRIIYPPEVGRLILFPGWLEHGVLTNTTNNTRVSISFNIKFD